MSENNMDMKKLKDDVMENVTGGSGAYNERLFCNQCKRADRLRKTGRTKTILLIFERREWHCDNCGNTFWADAGLEPGDNIQI